MSEIKSLNFKKEPKEKSYLVESIEFDFDEIGDGDPQFQLSQEEKEFIETNTLGVWYAYDDDHLLDKISDRSGYVIKSIEYGKNRPHKLTAFL